MTDTPRLPGEMLREFHRVYGAPMRQIPTAVLPEHEKKLRDKLAAEEHDEYEEAIANNDPVELADALGDMAYILYGTALAHGIDLDAVVAEIHRSNMSKLGEDGKPILREDGKILKGPGYFKPDLHAVLRRQVGPRWTEAYHARQGGSGGVSMFCTEPHREHLVHQCVDPELYEFEERLTELGYGS